MHPLVAPNTPLPPVMPAAPQSDAQMAQERREIHPDALRRRQERAEEGMRAEERRERKESGDTIRLGGEGVRVPLRRARDEEWVAAR